jgi:hypothetical protein
MYRRKIMGSRFVEREGGLQPAIPGESSSLSPEVHLGYNVDDELVKIKKFINGKIFDRDVDDPDVVDKVVDRWVEYGEWYEI